MDKKYEITKIVFLLLFFYKYTNHLYICHNIIKNNDGRYKKSL